MGSNSQLVVFLVNDEEYAVNIDNVQEIIRYIDITRVPYASPCMAGVINLRGMIIPVMDIRKRFGMAAVMPDEATRIVIISWQGLLMGAIVDGVSEVLRMPAECIEPPPASSENVNSRYFAGIGKLSSRLLIILNLEKVLDINTETQKAGERG